MNNDTIKIDFKIPLYMMDDESNKFIIFDWKHFEINFFIDNSQRKHLWYISVNKVKTKNYLNTRGLISKKPILKAISDYVNENVDIKKVQHIFLNNVELNSLTYLKSRLPMMNKELDRDRLTKFGLTIKNAKFE